MNKDFTYDLLDPETLHVININLHADLNLAFLPFEKSFEGDAELMIILYRGSTTFATAEGVAMLLKQFVSKKSQTNLAPFHHILKSGPECTPGANLSEMPWTPKIALTKSTRVMEFSEIVSIFVILDFFRAAFPRPAGGAVVLGYTRVTLTR
jgi:hypothetical protein